LRFFTTLGLGTSQGVADLCALLSKCSLVVPESFEFASSPLFSLEAGRWAVSQSFLSAFVAANGGKTVDRKTLELLPSVIRRCTRQGRLNIRPPLWGPPPASCVHGTIVQLVLGAIKGNLACGAQDPSSRRRIFPSTSTAPAVPAGTSSDGALPRAATGIVAGRAQTGEGSLVNELAARAAAAAMTMASDDVDEDGHTLDQHVIALLSMRSHASSSRAGHGALADSRTVVSVADGLSQRLPAHTCLSLAAAAALTPPQQLHAVRTSLVPPNASRARTESDPVRRQALSTAASDAARVPELPVPSQLPPPGSLGGGLLPQLPPGIFLCRSAPGGFRAVPSAPDSCNTRAVSVPLSTMAASVPRSTNDASTMAVQPSSSPITEKGSPQSSLVAVATGAPVTAPTAGTGSSLTVFAPPTDSVLEVEPFLLLARRSPFRSMHPPSPLQSLRLSLPSCLLRQKACLFVWAVPNLWRIVSCLLPLLQRHHMHKSSCNQNKSKAGACLASQRTAGLSISMTSSLQPTTRPTANQRSTWMRQ